jgi:hypothetical protein
LREQGTGWLDGETIRLLEAAPSPAR